MGADVSAPDDCTAEEAVDVVGVLEFKLLEEFWLGGALFC